MACSSCGAAILASQQFCDACGAPIGDEQATAEGVRKVVTVLFADLAGSTSWQEALDAESAQHVMSRFLRRDAGGDRFPRWRRGEVHRRAVVAVFGIPQVTEDDALQAVRAADAMVHSLVDLNEELERVWGGAGSPDAGGHQHGRARNHR